MSRQTLSTKRQWLITNGLGGFAFGTESGIPTRRYHGLLVAALNPPVRRTIALHSVMEQIEFDDGELLSLATFQFGDSMQQHPDGWKRLVQFQRISDQEVSWTYDFGRLRVNKHVRLQPLSNAVTLLYELEGALPKKLRLRPMTPMRGIHSMSHQGWGEPQAQQVADGAMLVHSGDVRLRLIGRCHDVDAQSHIEPQWWNDVRYREDRARGQDWAEDLWSPGVIEFEFDARNRTAEAVTCRLDADIAAPLLPPVSADDLPESDTSSDRLPLAAQQFVVKRLTPDRSGYLDSIIAGYPWFADWGRDAMISLPGLLLSSGQTASAVSVLQAFAASIRNGLVPNCFDDGHGGAQYNSVDASLWFVHAVAQVVDAVNQGTRHELIEHCRQIVTAYTRGTEFDIRMTDDGLIAAGNEHTQITWMDAARDGIVFTPRHGKAVEINALWYNALRSLAAMIDRDAERDEMTALADRAAESFRAQFWCNERDCLHDVLAPTGTGGFASDEKLRPNQIFAVSLPYSPLKRVQQRAVVQVVEQRLLTPYGLRTLEPDDPEYVGRFEGNLFARDGAYHQGTVWPWLIGPFCEALLRVNDFDDASKSRVREIITSLINELDTGCIGQIAEVYDGDAPHRPDGCVAQAWSVAELLRVQWLLNQRSDHSTMNDKAIATTR